MSDNPHELANEIHFSPSVTGFASRITGLANDFPTGDPANIHMYDRLLREYFRNSKNLNNTFEPGKKLDVLYVVHFGHDDVSGPYVPLGTTSYAQVNGYGMLILDSQQVSETESLPYWKFIDTSDGNPNVESSASAGIENTPWAANWPSNTFGFRDAISDPIDAGFTPISITGFFNTGTNGVLVL